MSDPLLSVIVPTFHREVMLREAVRSVLGQRDVALEVLVLDDSAEASARDVVLELQDPRVRYVHCAVPSNGQPAKVRNAGLAMARGRYVYFLDDDDITLDGALAALTSALDRDPTVGVAIGLVVPFGEDESALAHERMYFARGTRRLRSAHGRFSLVATLLFEATPLVNSGCAIRRSCAEAVGGYSTRVALCEDVDFYLRAIRRSGFVLVDRPVVHYRTGTPSLMHSAHEPSTLRESYREIYHRYRLEYGNLEFTALRTYNAAASLIVMLLGLLGTGSFDGL